MKTKMFILTFLMMMSCPFLFGQQSHWTDPVMPGEDVMIVTSQVTLDGELQSSESYEVAVFNADDDKLVEVGTFTNHSIAELAYHVGLTIPGGIGDKFYFKFFNGTNEYVSLTKIDYADQQGSHSALFTIEFKSVAQIEGDEFDVVYSSLQEAIDAAKNGDEITLLQDNAENVTVVQAPDVAFTINGDNNTMTGTITVDGKSQAYATAGLTIKNVDFNATNIAKDASINLGGGDNNTRYTNGVTVENCNFTGDWDTTGEEKSAIKNYTGGCKNLTVIGGTFTGLHSLMQVKGVDGIAVSDVTVSNCKNGISVGTSTNVAISASTISATGYGVRADGEVASTMTLTNNSISAELPVVVRNVKEVAYNLTIAGDNNNFTALKQGTNTEGYQVVFTTGDDGTYVAPTTGQFVLTAPENFNVYPVYVAELNGKKYETFDDAYNAAKNGDVITLFRTVVLDNSKRWWNYSTKNITVKAEFGDVAFRVQSGNTSMVQFGSMTIDSDDYCIIVGSSDSSIEANVDILGGTYKGATTAISVTKGRVNIMDGTFQVEPYQGSYEYTINCIDANYKNGTAEVSIKGGKFYNFNPQNNAAEGAGTDFLTAKYAAVQDAEGYWNVVSAVAMIDVENNTDDKYFATLPEAFAAAEPGQTVTLLKDAAGAGLKINKNVTIDFGGKTYTINQAVGSKGTESQGFQILKEATEVTLKNGNVAVAGKETNVVWMINDYSAKLNVTDLTFDCANMNWDKTPNVYFLVANNQHGTDPAVTLNNVTVNNFAEGSPYFMEANTTLASADANLNIDVDPGYRVVYEKGVYSVEKLVAYFKNGAYARFVQDKNREHFSLSVYDVYAEYSLVVKVYHNETLLVTTTLREYDLDDPDKKFYPYTSGPKGITVNNVVNLGEEGCKPAGSWLNEWAVAPTVENVPNRYEVWVDGELNGELDLTESEFAGFSSKENLQTYLGFKSVYKQASITRGEDVTYYMTFDEALAASQANDVITVLDPVVVTVDKTYNFTGRTIKGENVYPVFRIQDGATVTVEGGEVTNPTDYVFVLGDSEQTTSGYLTIKNGTFQGESTVASVTKGNLTIEGGDFSLVEGTTDYRYLINCIDANYKNGTATVAIKGGTFHNWNPQNNAAESTGTNFCAQGYAATEYPANVWTVLPAVAQINETLYATLQDAINKVADSQTIKLLSNCDENVTIVQTEGFSFTIDGQIAEDVKAEYTGTFQIDGNGGYDRQETLTIKNITFNNVSNTALTYIDAKTKTQSHNVTVEGCDFGGNGNKNAKAISVIEGNNWNVIGCTVNENYNIFVDYAGAYNKIMNKNLLVDDCEINANQGVLLGRFSTGCTIANSTFTNNTCGINVAGRVDTKEGEVLSHTLKDVVFNGEAITANYPTAAPYHTHIFNVEGYVQSAASESFPDEIADHSDYLNFVLTKTESTLQAKGQDYLNVSISEELAAKGYEAVYEGDTYVVREIQNVKNVTKGTTYPTLAKAIEAASANDELLLLANVTEDVTINNNLTINGKPESATKNNTFTGKMAVSNADITIKNVNFDGNGRNVYAIETRQTGSVVIENCAAKNYNLGFLQNAQSNNTTTVKNVTISEVAYGLKIDYSNGVVLDNVKITATTAALLNSNYGYKIITIKDSELNILGTWKRNENHKTDYKFEGTNKIDEFITEANLDIFNLAAIDATLKAIEGLAVSTTVEGCVVEYEEGETVGFGTYSVIAANVALYRGEDLVKEFATIQDAIDAAENGDKIVVLEDLTFDDDDVISIDGIKTIISVKEKEITLNNEFNISVSYKGDPFLHCVVYVADNSGLTLTGNGTIDVTGVAGTINPSNGKYDYNIAYIFFKKGTTGYLTINGGNFTAPDLEDSMIYSQGSRLVTVNGGKFTLYNVGTQENGCPWIFNVKGSNEGAVVVKGGTFNADVNHQYWAHEVYVPKTLALKDNGYDTWTVVESEAYITEISSNYNREVGYATLAEAFEATKIITTADNTVTVVKNIELAESITVNAGEEVILDLNGMTLTGKDNNASGSFNLFVNKGTFEIKDSSAEGTGMITLEATTNRAWNASSSIVSNNAGTLTITSGTLEHLGGTDMAYGIDNNSTLGLTTLNVNGGKIASPYRAIRQFQNSLQDNVVIVNGGTISARAGIWMQQPSSNDNAQLGTLTINDGIFECVSNAVVIDICGGAQSNVTINGGTFSNTNENANLLLIWPLTDMNSVHENCSAVMNITGGNFTCAGEGKLIGILDGADANGDVVLTGGTYSEDVNAYCAEGFVAVDNGDGTWTVMPCQEQHLVAGWNWYSTYLDIETADLTNAIGSNGTEIKNQDGGKTYYVSQLNKWSGSLDIDFSKMYMINVNEACSLQVASSIVNAEEYTINLRTGWSWIGYPSDQEVDINTALANIPEPKDGDRIKSQYNGFAEYIWGSWRGSLKTLVPGIGYMYNNKSGEVKEFKYNFATTTRGAVEANVTAENNYWTPNTTTYPFNMTMTAVVDGLANGNYEVAAFVNGEVRGSARPIYIEEIDSYVLFLTIHGDDVEEMSFRLYDIDTDTEYDLSDRINYSNNAEVGSLDNPYTFTRGTTGIGEAAMSNINIYPNPTTIGTEINLEATCDKVEVFNALGVKVVEYQNVDSIDALETAGIYVIRITNNGNVQNCRLVVK